jgi:transcriptional regulator with XRE-family HTH domain
VYEKYATLRDKAGLTDTGVAAAAGIPVSTMHDWRQRAAKNPDAGISVAHLKKIADLLEVPLEKFLED